VDMELIGMDGRYDLRTQLGQGTRGAVYAAVDLRRRLPVVVRRFDKAIATDALARYAEVSATIRRAGITAAVTPYEVVAIPDPAPFAVFTAYDGYTLESQLYGDALQWARAVEIVASCAETLAAVQAATGEIHGDLKPSNMWITEKGEILVLDLGTAGLGPLGPVRRGAEIVDYRAPEQLDGTPGDAHADVFALGVLLVELTTGIHPFAGATAFQAAQKLTQTPPDLGEFTRGMSGGAAREAAKFVTRVLAGKPEDRYPDAQAFSTALAYIRGIVGTPTPLRTRPAAPLPTSLPPDPSIADPTTIQRLPNLRELFKHMAAPIPPAVVAPAEPPPAEPAPQQRPLPTSPTPVAAPASTSSRGIPADSTERELRPHVDGDATQALPRIVHSPTRAKSEIATVQAAVDGIERDFRPRVDHDATEILPQIVRKPVPASDEIATIALPRRFVLPRPPPETTMILPETGAQVQTTLELAIQIPAEHTSLSTKSEEPPLSPTSSRSGLRPPSARLQWILIGINLCVVLVLVGLAWAVMR
jgi:serine/threonine protein kinase